MLQINYSKSSYSEHFLQYWVSYNTTTMLPILEYGLQSMPSTLNTTGMDYTKMLKNMRVEWMLLFAFINLFCARLKLVTAVR